MRSVDLVRKMGIPGNYAGHKQLILAVELAIENEDCILNMYRDIYAVVGDKFGASAVSVEKNIRTVLQAAWQRSNHTQRCFEEIAGYPCPHRPCTSEFLDIVSNYLRNTQLVSETNQMVVPK